MHEPQPSPQAALSHREAELLLPWLAHGEMPDADRAALCEHLKSCELCCRELAHLGELGRWLTLSQEDGVSTDWNVERVSDRRIEARLRRLTGLQAKTDTAGKMPAPRRAAWPEWWRSALLAQAALLAVAVLFWLGRPIAVPGGGASPSSGQTSSPSSGQTSSPSSGQTSKFATRTQETPVHASAGALWRMVPVPALTEAELRAWLLEAELEIVGGPSARGVYTLAARNPARDVAAWRGDARLLLLEPVAGAGP